MSRHYAHKLIGGSEIATNLLTAVNIPHPCEIQPVHERQVRPLTVLEPNQQRDVWEEAVRTAPVGKVCHFRTPAISVSGELSDETAETASGPSGLGSGRRWTGAVAAGDGSGGPLAAWQGYPCPSLGCPFAGRGGAVVPLGAVDLSFRGAVLGRISVCRCPRRVRSYPPHRFRVKITRRKLVFFRGR